MPSVLFFKEERAGGEGGVGGREELTMLVFKVL